MADRRSVDLNQDIIHAIKKHYPRALSGDIEENAACASAISVALGGMVAQAYRLNGAVAGRTTLQGIVGAIMENIEAVDAEASKRARKDIKLIN